MSYSFEAFEQKIVDELDQVVTVEDFTADEYQAFKDRLWTTVRGLNELGNIVWKLFDDEKAVSVRVRNGTWTFVPDEA